jgi:hypothetical protein
VQYQFYHSLHRETPAVGTPEKKEVEKKVDVVDEDSKASENGDVEKPKENGTTDDKDSAEDSKDKEVESAENGDSTGTFYLHTFYVFRSVHVHFINTMQVVLNSREFSQYVIGVALVENLWYWSHVYCALRLCCNFCS